MTAPRAFLGSLLASLVPRFSPEFRSLYAHLLLVPVGGGGRPDADGAERGGVGAGVPIAGRGRRRINQHREFASNLLVACCFEVFF